MKHKSIQKMRIELLIKKLDEEYAAIRFFKNRLFNRQFNLVFSNNEKYYTLENIIRDYERRLNDIEHRIEILRNYRKRHKLYCIY